MASRIQRVVKKQKMIIELDIKQKNLEKHIKELQQMEFIYPEKKRTKRQKIRIEEKLKTIEIARKDLEEAKEHYGSVKRTENKPLISPHFRSFMKDLNKHLKKKI